MKNTAGTRVTIPVHSGTILHSKLLKSIFPDAGLTVAVLETLRSALRPATARVRKCPRHPGLEGFWRVTLVFSAVGLANWIVYTWLPLYLYEQFGMTLTSAGFSATFYIQAASFAGIFIGGLAADYLGTRRLKGRIWVQCAGLAAAAPFLFLIGVASSQALLIVALVLFGLGRGSYDSNAMPVLCQIAPAQLRSTGYGVFNLVSCIVGGISAGTAGYLKSALGLSVAFQTAGAILIAAALILLTVRLKPATSGSSIA